MGFQFAFKHVGELNSKPKSRMFFVHYLKIINTFLEKK